MPVAPRHLLAGSSFERVRMDRDGRDEKTQFSWVVLAPNVSINYLMPTRASK